MTRMVLFVNLLAITACAAVPERTSRVIMATRQTEGVELLSSKRGVLVVHNGCLRLRSETGTLYMLVWPIGTLFRSGSPGTVTDLAGKTNPLGALVEIQGGTASAEDFDPTTDLGTVIQQCGGGPVFLADSFVR